MNTLSVPFEATYFREYGIHPVTTNDQTDYIASFATWEDTIDALRSDMPDSGDVITPEYAAAPSNPSDLTTSSDLMRERLREAMDTTRNSDATLHLGLPYHSRPSMGRSKWLNTVVSIHRGQIKGIVHKQTLVPAEIELGIKRPEHESRRVQNGRAVMICAELFLYPKTMHEYSRGKDLKTVLAPTVWSVPALPGEAENVMARTGVDRDTYFKDQLECAIGGYALRHMPSVRNIIVSDKSITDLKPYNAVFRRTTA